MVSSVDHNRTIINKSNRFHGLTNSVPVSGAMMESLDLVMSGGRGGEVFCAQTLLRQVSTARSTIVLVQWRLIVWTNRFVHTRHRFLIGWSVLVSRGMA
ncbi:hypothetical protein Bpfe_028615 [Biomphalaria pfeifferi]|uniref:Uncharacterized protein n=1 Tax=Biomphalaria pfeifferi TaxID=112525 RepID=A0AAD8AVY1_BIOPF|nr:hypothetical protein Bpfe_028615 [Biomphalaria pfeifferi]